MDLLNLVVGLFFVTLIFSLATTFFLHHHFIMHKKGLQGITYPVKSQDLLHHLKVEQVSKEGSSFYFISLDEQKGEGLAKGVLPQRIIAFLQEDLKPFGLWRSFLDKGPLNLLINTLSSQSPIQLERKLKKEFGGDLSTIKVHGIKIVVPRDFPSKTQILSNLTSQCFIRTSGQYLDKIAKKSTQLYLLLQIEGLEIIRQDIDENKRFVLYGEEGWDGFEFIFLLKGDLHYLEEDQMLKPGDFISTKALRKNYYFKTKTPVSLLYLTNASVFQSQTMMMENLISLTHEVEEKDPSTESHCHRLQELTMLIGEAMNLSDKSLFPLIYAAYLHDIGKIHVKKSILHKEGALSQGEWEIMKKHPQWGREIILEKMKGFFVEQTVAIVYQHHEHFDGKGYPQGLKGQEILVEAQIVSIADAFDAITSNRPYKKALSHKDAIEVIKKASGSQFNPLVVEAFLKVVDTYLLKLKETDN